MPRGTPVAERSPAIAAQWHPTRNGDLTPHDVLAGSSHKHWWICPHGHDYESAPSNRIKGHGCPYCSGRKAGYGRSLADENPDFLRDWHPDANLPLTPRDVLPQSSRKVWWQCRKGHEWQATPSDRHAGKNCPYCAGRKVGYGNDLATLNPALAAEWHPTRNGALTPSEVTTGSNKKVWWQCARGHEWSAAVHDRNCGRGCGYCSRRLPSPGQSLAATHPELAAQWHPTRNGTLTPDGVLAGTQKKAWWQCEQGHEWEANVANRARGRLCPYCSGRKVGYGNDLATLNPALAAEWHPTRNGALTPSEVTTGSNKKVWWQCRQGHEWVTAVYARSRSGCMECAPKSAGGFRSSKPGFLYILHAALRGRTVVQFGITNDTETRILAHRASGFKNPPLAVIEFQNGRDARDLEVSLLRLMNAMSVKSARKSGYAFEGATEAFLPEDAAPEFLAKLDDILSPHVGEPIPWQDLP